MCHSKHSLSQIPQASLIIILSVMIVIIAIINYEIYLLTFIIINYIIITNLKSHNHISTIVNFKINFHN